MPLATRPSDDDRLDRLEILVAGGAGGPQGPQGPQGEPGTPGADGTNGTNGTNGVGVPTGGTSGQVLAKNSNTNYDTHWITVSGGGGSITSGGASFDDTVTLDLNSDTTESLQILAADGTNAFEFYGNRVLHIGPESSLTTAVKAWGRTIISLEAPTAGGGGDSGMIMTSGTNKITCTFHTRGNDAGFSFGYNYRPEQGAPNGTYGDPNLPQVFWMIETDGAFSIIYSKPINTNAGSYDSLGGKPLAIYAGGFEQGVGGYSARGPYVSYCCMQVGRGLDFGVSDTSVADPVFKLRIDGDGSSNPISMWLNGALKNVTVGAADSGGSGYRMMRVLN